MNGLSRGLGTSVLALVLAIIPGAAQANTDITLKKLDVRDADHYGLPPAGIGKLVVIGTVYNGGTTAVPRGIDVECQVRLQRRVLAVGRSTLAKSVLSRKTAGFALVMSGTGKAGRFTLQCTLDTKNRLREQNRGNNVARKALSLRPFNGKAYRLKIQRVSPISSLDRNFKSTVSFTVGGLQADLPPYAASNKHQPMWALSCTIANMPWVKIRERGHMLKLVTGKTPYRGKTTSSAAWVDGLRLAPHPWVDKFAPQLPLRCTISVGVFHKVQRTWVDRSRPSTPSVNRWTAWEPVQTWWKGTQNLVLVNKLSRQYNNSAVRAAVKKDVSLRCAGASRSTNAAQVRSALPKANRETYLHVTVTASASMRYRHALVACTVNKGRRKIRVGAKNVRHATGKRAAVIKLGRLRAGVYSYRCVLDSLKRLPDSDRSNNTCTGRVDVGF